MSVDDEARWKVRGREDFDVGEDGFPIGEPTDFQGLRVQRVGRGR